MNKCVIDITGEIQTSTYLHIINRIKDLKKEDEIILLINSAGGDLYQGFAIYDILSILPNHINTIAVGYCDSTASILFSLGRKRYITINTEYLMHSVCQTYCENESITLTDVRDTIRNFESDNNKIINCLLKSKGIKVTYGELKEKFDSGKNHIFTPEKLLEMGIATDILEDIYDIFKE